MTTPFYKLTPEEQYRIKRSEEAKQHAENIAKSNSMLVGKVKTYKGIDYQSNQYSLITCLNLPPLSGLQGEFTSAQALHKIIDDMEVNGNLYTTENKSKK